MNGQVIEYARGKELGGEDVLQKTGHGTWW